MRIKRSTWKFPFNHFNFTLHKDVKVFDRNITLTSKFLDKSLKCYKGKVVGKILINKHNLGHKLGEFFITKVLGERIAYRKKQKMLLKKNKNKQKKK
jgi:ribosomal protein S19